ncbi:FAD-binding protein [Arenibacter sp. GZD96]|uniref:D-arabinono-1,4-lactone oxidase n=1 Tax=Aurantibrevibacter litoralis TaxID=3106030 RepID=UPI002AFF17E6|nr:D-arabinono-1,4-lactone oxidase [Arenibacter sp. GZD-96]MEA1785811.1 FAD-binding protein [Arenibacter sp. GZD-96]
MQRKTFIKKASLAVTGGMLLPTLSCVEDKKTKSMVEKRDRKNWAGNYSYRAENLHEPTSVDEVQHLVRTLDQQKALGSTHCFNAIADSPKHQISTKKLNKVIALDAENKTLTVEAGARYGDFAEMLHQEGFALHNLASLPHISVAGACATATHGSGVTNGNLATAVVGIEMVRPDGDIVVLDKNHPHFNAVVVGLGAFGIITKVTLEIQPTYNVRQDVFLDLPLESVLVHFDEIMASGYSVSLFTDWMDTKISEVWIKRRMDGAVADLGHDFYGAKAATAHIHPIVSISAENCTDQMGIPGPWYDRLPHFKMGFMPSAGEELQSEYYIPREHAVAAIMAIEKMKAEIFPHILISEIRTIAADNFWMSPCYQQDCITIHTTWKQKTKEVLALLPKIEAALAPYQPKPHWGKLFTLDAKTLQSRYAKHSDFVALAKSYDPKKKFVNEYLKNHVFDGS